MAEKTVAELLSELVALLREDAEQETTPYQTTEMIAKERITFGWVVGSGGKRNIRF
jgi:hypothetical protein